MTILGVVTILTDPSGSLRHPFSGPGTELSTVADLENATWAILNTGKHNLPKMCLAHPPHHTPKSPARLRACHETRRGFGPAIDTNRIGKKLTEILLTLSLGVAWTLLTYPDRSDSLQTPP